MPVTGQYFARYGAAFSCPLWAAKRQNGRAGVPPASKGRGRAREREQDFPARLRAAYEGQFVGRTLSLVPEEQKEGFTVGYSENYIRIYVQGTLARKTDVRALRPFKDGLLAAPQ